MPADLVTAPSRNVGLLYPTFASLCKNAIDLARRAGHEVAIFEAWRSPQRQEWLYEQGRTRPGKIVTKARGWESWHQLGCAVDLAMYDGTTWSWNGEWDKVLKFFTDYGLESLRPFETCHVQLTGGMDVHAATALMRSSGLQRVWMEIDYAISQKKGPGAAT